MKFTETRIANNMMNIDGYSTNKTLRGALKDLAREVANYNEIESKAIVDYIEETIDDVKNGMENISGCYYIHAEEVPCASRYIFKDGDTDNFDVENVEIEYAPANWYLYIRYAL